MIGITELTEPSAPALRERVARLVATHANEGLGPPGEGETLGGPCAGTFGMFEKGLRRSESLPRAALLLLGHLPADARHIRTNIGYFNASPDPAQATFRVHAADGRVLGARTMTLAGFANDQRSVFELVDSVPESERNQRDLYVTFEAQGGLLFVYGSAVYNSTNDALYVIPWQY